MFQRELEELSFSKRFYISSLISRNDTTIQVKSIQIYKPLTKHKQPNQATQRKHKYNKISHYMVPNQRA